jgi:hypothetical protein
MKNHMPLNSRTPGQYHSIEAYIGYFLQGVCVYLHSSNKILFNSSEHDVIHKTDNQRLHNGRMSLREGPSMKCNSNLHAGWRKREERKEKVEKGRKKKTNIFYVLGYRH